LEEDDLGVRTTCIFISDNYGFTAQVLNWAGFMADGKEVMHTD
jgi:hypothetical protein